MEPTAEIRQAAERMYRQAANVQPKEDLLYHFAAELQAAEDRGRRDMREAATMKCGRIAALGLSGGSIAAAALACEASIRCIRVGDEAMGVDASDGD